jgi:hypothetical protein
VELREINGYLCTASLAPLTDARQTVRCPLDGSVFAKNIETLGRVCDTCGLCKLGEATTGLTNLV